MYTAVWGVFLFFASEAKVKDRFEGLGNIIDFGRAFDSSFHTSSKENYFIQHSGILLMSSLPCSSPWMQFQVSRGERLRTSIGSSNLRLQLGRREG